MLCPEIFGTWVQLAGAQVLKLRQVGLIIRNAHAESTVSATHAHAPRLLLPELAAGVAQVAHVPPAAPDHYIMNITRD